MVRGIIMKKWLFTLLMIFAIGLAACGGEETEQVDATEEETEAETEEEAAEEQQTPEDIYEQAMEAAEGMESAEIVLDMTQTIEIPAESVSMDMTTTTEAEMTMDPLTMYQNGTVTLEADGTTEESEMELYLTEDELYMYDGMSQTWMKMDSSTIPMDQINSQQQDPSAQLELMEQFVDEMELEENDEQYILKITGDGEELQAFTQEVMAEYMDQELMASMGEEGNNVMDNMAINSVYYEVFVDKETYDMTAFNMDMDMSMDAEEQQMNIVQSVTSEYTGMNTVEPIEVPQEVQDEAIDVMEEMEQMEGTEEIEGEDKQ